MKINFDFCVKSIGAGALIGIAGVAFAQIGGLIGAFAFGLGLYLVIVNELWLYTGRIGYVDRNSFSRTLLSLPFNLIGAALVGICFYNSYESLPCLEIVYKKLELPYTVIVLRAALCGAMMVCAVESWRRTKQWIGVFLSVFIFVACGFEHCIADTFYITACNYVNYDSVLFIAKVFCGNTLGSLLMNMLISKKI